MPKFWKLILGGIGLIFLGSLVGIFVSWRLYQNGMIFNERVIPNPVIEYTKQGRYDDAIRAALSRIVDERKDYGEYDQVVLVYLARAYKDEPNREKWVQQAVSYIDRMVSLGPTDFASLQEAAYEYDKAGDLAKSGCPYYGKGAKVCVTIDSLLQGDSLTIRDLKIPTQDLRKGNQSLERRIQGKLNAWCTNVAH
jgi:hypothetical protein